MAFDPKPHLGLLFLSLFCLSASAFSPPHDAFSTVSAVSPSPSVYEILPKFGLPRGLLPDSVVSHSLADDGSFVVVLEKPCYIQFDYLVYYNRRITGKLKYGSIKGLVGIEVQKFFLWFNVDEIKVDLPPSDSIYFQIGFINKRLDVGQFQTVHTCLDEVSASCGRSFKRVLQLPAATNEIQMLMME